MRIDCQECAMQGTGACEECVVSVILGRDPAEAVLIDVEEARAIRLMGGAGLVPPLRHVRRAS